MIKTMIFSTATAHHLLSMRSFFFTANQQYHHRSVGKVIINNPSDHLFHQTKYNNYAAGTGDNVDGVGIMGSGDKAVDEMDDRPGAAGDYGEAVVKKKKTMTTTTNTNTNGSGASSSSTHDGGSGTRVAFQSQTSLHESQHSTDQILDNRPGSAGDFGEVKKPKD